MKATTLYHGGPDGLKVGELIRPAVSTGKAHAAMRHQPHYNPHRVYVTQDHSYAHFFASQHQGVVYEVLPVGRLIADQDARNSFTCSAAEIVAIHQTLPIVTAEWTSRISRAGGYR
jgi:hypothetical protein